MKRLEAAIQQACESVPALRDGIVLLKVTHDYPPGNHVIVMQKLQQHAHPYLSVPSAIVLGGTAHKRTSILSSIFSIVDTCGMPWLCPGRGTTTCTWQWILWNCLHAWTH